MIKTIKIIPKDFGLKTVKERYWKQLPAKRLSIKTGRKRRKKGNETLVMGYYPRNCYIGDIDPQSNIKF